MPDPSAREPTNPSAGGARAAGGLVFQAEVFAWWAAQAASDTAPGLGLEPAVHINAVGCETGFPVDDVGVAPSDGGFILEALLTVVKAAWTAAAGGAPTENELRRFLRVLEVRRLDFEEGTGADRIRAGAMLKPAAVAQPFSLLVTIGMEAARRRRWRQRDELIAAVKMRSPGGGAAPSGTRPVRDWGAQRLGVHRAIVADAVPGQAVPELTVYVQRKHDAQLRELLSAPAGPGMLVLVGGSSTGKTRAAFEAVRQCLADWSLLRPLDAADLLDQLRGGAVGPQMVLWLNETQIFLRGSARRRGRPAAAARAGRAGGGDRRDVARGMEGAHVRTGRWRAGREPAGEGAAATRCGAGGGAGDVHWHGPPSAPQRAGRRPAPGNGGRGSWARRQGRPGARRRARARAAL